MRLKLWLFQPFKQRHRSYVVNSIEMDELRLTAKLEVYILPLLHKHVNRYNLVHLIICVMKKLGQ